MREQWDYLRLQEPQTITASMAKEKTMAERQEETRQEKETRWAAQRAAHEKDQQGMQAARQRKTVRNWLIVGAIVIIVAVIAVVVLR